MYHIDVSTDHGKAIAAVFRSFGATLAPESCLYAVTLEEDGTRREIRQHIFEDSPVKIPAITEPVPLETVHGACNSYAAGAEAMPGMTEVKRVYESARHACAIIEHMESTPPLVEHRMGGSRIFAPADATPGEIAAIAQQ